MDDLFSIAKLKDITFAFALTQPRILTLCLMLPIFSRQLLPGRLRGAVVMALGLLMVPVLLPHIEHVDFDVLTLVGLILKESFIGLVLGFFVAMPFWIFEAMGSYIDYQRGASMGAFFNPTMGTEATSLALLFQLAYGVYFLSGAGLPLTLSMLYDSFRLWDVWQWTPTLHVDAIAVLLSQLDRLLELVVLFSAPVVVTMLLAELGLALASRFTPQLQVFFLAMPIKSGLAMLILALYMSTLLQNIGHETARIAQIVPFLSHMWGPR
jgi:type III secretion protein T